MVKSGSVLWIPTYRYRVYYLGFQVKSVMEMGDNKFSITDVAGKVYKEISDPLDEVLYVEEVTIRTKHNGINSIMPRT